MTASKMKTYTITLPEDTAALLDAYCESQPLSPNDNIISRLIRDGIEAGMALHPDIAKKLGYKLHHMSIGIRLLRGDAEWLPIESAPEGEEILLLGPEWETAGIGVLDTEYHDFFTPINGAALTPRPTLWQHIPARKA